MVTDIYLKYVLSYRVYASCHGCIIIQCLHCMIALCWRLLVFCFLELYQLLQYSYNCSSVMSVHPEGGGLLVFCNVTNKIRKRTDTAVAFTQEYSRVSYPLGNVSTLSTGSDSPRTH